MAWYSNSEGRHGVNGRKGDLGEKLVENYFLKNSIIYEHKTDIISQVHKKIDFSVGRDSIDVKTNIYKDWHCVELEKKNGDPGWLYASTADKIYAVDYDNKNIYSYELEQMREHVEDAMYRSKRTKYGDLVVWVNVDDALFTQLQ